MGITTGSKSGMMSEINVTPFVDVMLVLLIVFMITAPMMQQGLDVDLPEIASSGVATSDEPFVIVIKKNKAITLGNAIIPINQLKQKLIAIFQNRKNKQVYIQADKHVEYGMVAETMGEIRSAGIYNISLIALPKTDTN